MQTGAVARPSILVVGSINMDLVLRATRMPRPGESMIGETYCHIPGGKGANQAVGAARLGAAVTFVGKLGADANGVELRQTLVEQGISVDFVVVHDQSQTGLAVITLDAEGENSIIVFPGANMEIREEELHPAFFAGRYDALVLQLEVPRHIVVESCRLAREAGIPIILDAGPAQAFPLEDTPGIDILTPNETENSSPHWSGSRLHRRSRASRGRTCCQVAGTRGRRQTGWERRPPADGRWSCRALPRPQSQGGRHDCGRGCVYGRNDCPIHADGRSSTGDQLRQCCRRFDCDSARCATLIAHRRRSRRV